MTFPPASSDLYYVLRSLLPNFQLLPKSTIPLPHSYVGAIGLDRASAHHDALQALDTEVVESAAALEEDLGTGMKLDPGRRKYQVKVAKVEELDIARSERSTLPAAGRDGFSTASLGLLKKASEITLGRVEQLAEWHAAGVPPPGFTKAAENIIVAPPHGTPVVVYGNPDIPPEKTAANWWDPAPAGTREFAGHANNNKRPRPPSPDATLAANLRAAPYTQFKMTHQKRPPPEFVPEPGVDPKDWVKVDRYSRKPEPAAIVDPVLAGVTKDAVGMLHENMRVRGSLLGGDGQS